MQALDFSTYVSPGYVFQGVEGSGPIVLDGGRELLFEPRQKQQITGSTYMAERYLEAERQQDPSAFVWRFGAGLGRMTQDQPGYVKVLDDFGNSAAAEVKEGSDYVTRFRGELDWNSGKNWGVSGGVKYARILGEEGFTDGGFFFNLEYRLLVGGPMEEEQVSLRPHPLYFLSRPTADFNPGSAMSAVYSRISVFEDEYAGNSILFRFMFDYSNYETKIDLEPITGIPAVARQIFPGRMTGISIGYQPNTDAIIKLEFRKYFWGGGIYSQGQYLDLSQELRRQGVDNDATDRMVRYVPTFEVIAGGAYRLTPDLSLDVYGGLTRVLFSMENRTLLSPGFVYILNPNLRLSARVDYHMTELGSIPAFQFGVKWIL